MCVRLGTDNERRSGEEAATAAASRRPTEKSLSLFCILDAVRRILLYNKAHRVAEVAGGSAHNVQYDNTE